jgi:BirA family transcriptional regulator, biotin operon repressor / biotin---[acetyl-CoA-carboxylase] ligase
MTSFGHPHRHYRRTGSTNIRARELAAAGAPHGTVVTASEQSEGRGRQGRTWTAPPGKALLYSALLRPVDQRHALLPLAVPLAVCEAAEALRPGTECKVKWPNDVHLDGRKLAGVLIEARPRDGWAVIGVGLNLTIAAAEFPSELRGTATSLFALAPPSDALCRPLGDKVQGGVALADAGAALPGGEGTLARRAADALNECLGRWVDADAKMVLDAWRERDALRGREVEWEGGSGVADGVDDRGYLLVVTAAGERIAVGAGEVHLTRF